MKYYLPLLPFVIGFILILLIPNLKQLAFLNGISQIFLFVIVACIPAWKTGRMSYVDIAWPWGLVLIGLMTYFNSNGYWLRVSIISGIYIFIGLRMGLGALKMWQKGWFQTEFPRYQYQRLRWQRQGKTNEKLVIQIDVILQGLANTSFLAYPAFIIASNPNENISYIEIFALIIWLAAILMESIADMQKLKFLKLMKQKDKTNKVCNIGLWKYSRHPNYFAEWMIWNSLIIASIPSWIQHFSNQQTLHWIVIGLGLLFVSRIMYTTLVYFTGAKPAEFYSVQKRPEYKNYQQTTNIFIPGPKKKQCNDSAIK